MSKRKQKRNDDQNSQTRDRGSVIGREKKQSYQKYRMTTGRISQDNGDPIALELRDATKEILLKQASLACGLSTKELEAKYEHLNPGMRRMTLGNIIRASRGA